jgi:hypothetical protein
MTIFSDDVMPRLFSDGISVSRTQIIGYSAISTAIVRDGMCEMLAKRRIRALSGSARIAI